MGRGVFITFEGPDGSGKSTQIDLLYLFLTKQGIRTVVTREPGGTDIGEQIRGIILNVRYTEMDSLTEALLYAAARSQISSQIIRPNLENGNLVICDRFIDSSTVYQGFARNLGDTVTQINKYAVADLIPDITFLLKISPEAIASRCRSRDTDRMEMEHIAYHKKVVEGYSLLEKLYPERIRCIDGMQSIKEIHNTIVGQVMDLLSKRSPLEL
jgi:dTMP kinase